MKPITKHIFILFFSLLFLNSFKTQAQETDSLNLSLKQAVQKGLENNFGIRISKKDLNAAENNNSWGKAGLLPSVSVGANQTNRYDNSASQFSAGRDESYMNSLTPVFKFKNEFIQRIFGKNFKRKFRAFAIAFRRKFTNDIRKLNC